ncbi:MAG: hypothetical protein QOK08_727 [Actinomycetota bacterium]|jgi:predicted short-subunit dehydrogenase-like oxidoreductase (DUF2520 family)|nr:hypothetical protein [Glaciihabitans sp.]MDQ1529083.1 hypothetical protein [Actinomycetota bacterium]MDQ1543089.1 hypothetical protein [Actinomycetota bacterium]MDQ1561556.1 hypothetical protein [Actinomycetota bacterium]
MVERSGRLGIGIIGAGRVGPVFGAALAGAGHALVGISAVSQASRDRAEAMLPGVPILDIPTIVERSELVILAVPESELPSLVTGIAATGGWQPGQLVLHTAPTLGTTVLAPAQAQGAIPLAVHPAMAFTGTSIDLVRLRESYCAVTAASIVQPIGMALVVEMGAEPVLVEEKDRPAYAEAITIATTFSTAIVGQATGLLAEAGIPNPGRVLGGLVRSAVENALGDAGAGTIDLAQLPENFLEDD